jgi:hypothetical protein
VAPGPMIPGALRFASFALHTLPRGRSRKVCFSEGIPRLLSPAGNVDLNSSADQFRRFVRTNAKNHRFRQARFYSRNRSNIATPQHSVNRTKLHLRVQGTARMLRRSALSLTSGKRVKGERPLAALGISPGAPAPLTACPEQLSQAKASNGPAKRLKGSKDPSLRSGFCLRAPAPLTPAKRLKLLK